MESYRGLLERYVELEGQLRKVLSVVKMRGSDHSKDWRAYEITQAGMVVGEVLSAYRGIVSGIPVPRDDVARGGAGFTPSEADQLRQAMGSKRSRARMERLLEYAATHYHPELLAPGEAAPAEGPARSRGCPTWATPELLPDLLSQAPVLTTSQ